MIGTLWHINFRRFPLTFTFYRECSWFSCCRWRERQPTCRRVGSPARICSSNRSIWWRRVARYPLQSVDCKRYSASSPARTLLVLDASARFALRGRSSCDLGRARCWVVAEIAAVWVISWRASWRLWTPSACSSASDSTLAATVVALAESESTVAGSAATQQRQDKQDFAAISEISWVS